MNKKKILIGATVASALLLLAVPAFAESSFGSHLVVTKYADAQRNAKGTDFVRSARHAESDIPTLAQLFSHVTREDSFNCLRADTSNKMISVQNFSTTYVVNGDRCTITMRIRRGEGPSDPVDGNSVDGI